MKNYDLICIGAGPTGLACAIEAVRAGLKPLVIDKGTLCNSIFHYPVNMVFFTTPELLEIGDPATGLRGRKADSGGSAEILPQGNRTFGLEVKLYEHVLKLAGRDGELWSPRAPPKAEWKLTTAARWWWPQAIMICRTSCRFPVKNLPHVSHYYTEPHEFWNQDVVVVGGKNSAAEAALDLWRNGARVSMVHRDGELGASIKYWVKPDIENRVKANQIPMHFNSVVKGITPDEVLLEKRSREDVVAGKAGISADWIPPGL